MQLQRALAEGKVSLREAGEDDSDGAGMSPDRNQAIEMTDRRSYRNDESHR